MVTLHVQTEAFSSIPLQTTKPFVSRTLTGQGQFVHNLPARLNDEDENVNVFEVKDVDALNLTVIGFAAIAFNFFVLANMGDGGIGGIVARIINTFN